MCNTTVFESHLQQYFVIQGVFQNFAQKGYYWFYAVVFLISLWFICWRCHINLRESSLSVGAMVQKNVCMFQFHENLLLRNTITCFIIYVTSHKSKFMPFSYMKMFTLKFTSDHCTDNVTSYFKIESIITATFQQKYFDGSQMHWI